MRQYIILIITVSLILLMYFIQINYLKETKAYLDTDLYEIEMYINQDNFKEAKKSAKNLTDSFSKYIEAWDSYADHEDIENILEYICRINKYIELEEKTDVLVNTACLSNKLSHIIKSEEIKASNIF